MQATGVHDGKGDKQLDTVAFRFDRHIIAALHRTAMEEERAKSNNRVRGNERCIDSDQDSPNKGSGWSVSTYQ